MHTILSNVATNKFTELVSNAKKRNWTSEHDTENEWKKYSECSTVNLVANQVEVNLSFQHIDEI